MGHEPVLLSEVISLLNPQPHASVLDATVGAGGHAAALLAHTTPDGRLLGLDRDPDALAIAQRMLADSAASATLVHGSFEHLERLASDHGFTGFDCILFDLGLSSMELADANRGFSFRTEGPLDMRFDPCHDRTTAADLVNRLPFEKLRSILVTYGEEPHATAIAHAIVVRRKKQNISTTRQLLLAVRDAVRTTRGHIDPATRTFQAIRIAVNRELDALSAALPQALRLLNAGGRLAVISFHSLEDRIVKEFFKREARDCVCPPELPVCVCQHHSQLAILTPKPMRPGEAEVDRNRRSRSAKLRAIVKRTSV